MSDHLLPDGREITAHCPNPGRMSSILPSPEAVYLTDLSSIPSPKRKLDFRWELARVDGTFVVVNTQLANKVAANLLHHHEETRQKLGISAALNIRSEVSLPSTTGTTTRFDFAVETPENELVYLEVKQVSLRASDDSGLRWAAFPDAVTARGKRHLEELTRLRQEGHRTLLLYIVGRDDVDAVRPAHEIDSAYAEAFFRAKESGVEIFAVGLKADPSGLYFRTWLPVREGARSIPNGTRS